MNAAVGFDEATLQPTYELKIGVPGASAGINIAQRLGLNPHIIDSARSRIGTQTQDVGQFLDRLHAELREAEAERLRLRTREEEVENETKLAWRLKAAKSSRPKFAKWRRNSKAFSRLRISRAREPSTPSRIAPRRKNSQKTPNAASPKCAANSVSNSIPP